MASVSLLQDEVMSAEPPPQKIIRLQLDFEEAEMRVINGLTSELGLATRGELFRSSLCVLRWMAQRKAEGCLVVAVTPDELYIDPQFEFFDRIVPERPDLVPRLANATDMNDQEAAGY